MWEQERDAVNLSLCCDYHRKFVAGRCPWCGLPLLRPVPATEESRLVAKLVQGDTSVACTLLVRYRSFVCDVAEHYYRLRSRTEGRDAYDVRIDVHQAVIRAALQGLRQALDTFESAAHYSFHDHVVRHVILSVIRHVA